MFALALIRHALARSRGILLGVGALLVGLQVVIVLVAAEQYQAQAFDLIMRLAPSFVQRQLGPSLPVLLSFPGLVSFGYFHPVVILTITVVAALFASEPAGDVEQGHVDLLLAGPVARHWIITRSLILMLAVPMLLVGLMMAATWTTLLACAPSGAQWPDPRAIVRLGTHLAFVAWCFGGVALAVAAFARRRATALAAGAIGAVSLYLLELLAASWRPLRGVGVLSPFHYYQGSAVMVGSADVFRDLATLTLMTLPMVGLAYFQVARRDL